jgi:hypothetical protein
MRKILLPILLLLLQVTGATPSIAANCTDVNVSAIADDGATVTITSIQFVDKTGSTQLTITYQLQNLTPDKKLDEGSFKLFFSNGPAMPQYGGFGYLFPSDTKTRSYTWEYLKSQTPTVIEYNADFFAAKPTATKLHWSAQNGACDVGVVASPTPSVTQPSKTNSGVVDIVNQERNALTAEIALKMKTNPKLYKVLQPLLSQLAAAESPTESDADAKLKLVVTVRTSYVLTLKKFLGETPTSITCVKGKLKKVVTAVNPKCPAGYKITSK